MRVAYGRWFVGVRWRDDWAWLYPFNRLPPDSRYWGYEVDYYDGPLPTFGLWFFNVSWRW